MSRRARSFCCSLCTSCIVYAIIRGFGPAAQAGFGIGARVMQALFLPVVALSFAVSPVVGQNFGGRRADRVRHSVYSAIGIASLMMLVLTLIAFLAPGTLIRIFSRDPRVIAFGSEYLRIVSLNFISAGIVFVTSSIFQGIGNTLPPLFSSMTRLILFAVPAMLISRMPGFEIRELWYLSVGSTIFQMCVNLLLLRHELRKRLQVRRTGKFYSRECDRVVACAHSIIPAFYFFRSLMARGAGTLESWRTRRHKARQTNRPFARKMFPRAKRLTFQ